MRIVLCHVFEQNTRIKQELCFPKENKKTETLFLMLTLKILSVLLLPLTRVLMSLRYFCFALF